MEDIINAKLDFGEEDAVIDLIFSLMKNERKRIRPVKPSVVFGKKSCIKNKYSVLSGAILLIKLKNC